MALRIKALVCLAVVGAVASLLSILGHPAQQWLRFFVYLAAILLSSGMKVGLPKSEGTMSLNFPFILLGILQLSPLQAVGLAVCSVVAQCRFRVLRPFTLVQILFNVANVTTATVLAWDSYAGLLRTHWAVAPALAIATTVYFFSTTIPVALVIAWDQDISPLALWRRDFLWFLPFYFVGAILAATAYLIGMMFGWMTSMLLIPMVYTVYRTYSSQMAFVRDREQHAKDTEALHLRTIEGLAMAIEAKDQNTHKHLLRVRVYVAELGKLMKLDQPTMQALLIASYLHDIGKLAVPEYIINKPGKLTQEEFEKMKIHPVVGADILERVRFPYPVVPIVRAHHESWDGSGYPDGLKGEEIPIGARLLTAVDWFDALASERPYRKALPLEEAMAFMRAGAGIQFDPQIVELLEKNYLELEERARQQIGQIEPLKTNMTIVRGAAPGAGFEPEHLTIASRGKSAEAQSALASPAASQDTPSIAELVRMLDDATSVLDMNFALAERLRPLIPHDGLGVYLRSGEFLLPQFINGSLERAFSTVQMPLGEGLSGWVAEHARPIVNGNPTVEPNYLSASGLFTETNSALSVPFHDATGSVFGVITLYSTAAAAFSKDHLKILEAFESGLSQALQRALSLSVGEKGVKTVPDAASLAAL